MAVPISVSISRYFARREIERITCPSNFLSSCMSYGMMMCVQMDKKEEFDRIWKWTKTYMYMDKGENKEEEMMLCRGGGYSCYRRVEGNKDPLPSQDMKSSLSSCLAVLGSQSKLTTCPEGVPKRPLKILEKCPDCGGFSVLVAPASMNLSHNQPNSIHPIQCRTALKLQWSVSYHSLLSTERPTDLHTHLHLHFRLHLRSHLVFFLLIL